METGRVKFYNEARQFGFIIPDGGFHDIFFHETAIKCERSELRRGRKVRYTIDPNPKGIRPRAVDI